MFAKFCFECSWFTIIFEIVNFIRKFKIIFFNFIVVLAIFKYISTLVYRIILDGSDNNTFIEVTDVGLVMNILPTLEEVSTGIQHDISVNSTYELNPGDYKITIYSCRHVLGSSLLSKNNQ